MADQDVSKMKVADLKRELKNRGLNVTGNKNELAERLQSALIEGEVFDDAAISEELLDDNDDVLNDDELDEETKSFLNSAAHDEDAILSSPKGSTSSKSPENPPAESTTSTSAAPSQAKKVVLKRKLLSSISFTESDAPKTSTESKIPKIIDDGEKSDEQASEAKPSNGSSADGNVVKFSQLTMKERLELRAKKFGAAPTGDAAKLARAERFGISAATSTSGASTAVATATTATASVGNVAAQKPDVDLLKKRAERFGGSVSNTMVKIEEKEKLLKRQERFGNASTAISGTAKATTTTTTTTPVSTQAANDYADKAKQRLERFKTTA